MKEKLMGDSLFFLFLMVVAGNNLKASESGLSVPLVAAIAKTRAQNAVHLVARISSEQLPIAVTEMEKKKEERSLSSDDEVFLALVKNRIDTEKIARICAENLNLENARQKELKKKGPPSLDAKKEFLAAATRSIDLDLAEAGLFASDDSMSSSMSSFKAFTDLGLLDLYQSMSSFEVFKSLECEVVPKD